MIRGGPPEGAALGSELVELTDLLRHVVGRRVPDPHVAEDIVQETVARLLAARGRLDGRSVGPYAIVTARNLVTGEWQRSEVGRRHEHRLHDPSVSVAPDDSLIEREEQEAIRSALDRLSAREREVLVGHVVEGRDTTSLAQDLDTSPGAVAAQLSRSRAKLRVEYLVALSGDPPTSRCRPVLLAFSAGDRRRQAELDAGYHLLDCDFCASLSEPLFDRRAKSTPQDVRIGVQVDADVVVARQRARELAIRAGFSASEATAIATAVSEIARNIVKFARRGEVVLTELSDNGNATSGLMVVARDAGPGIVDVELALRDGYTTYGGHGLGLGGCRRFNCRYNSMLRLPWIWSSAWSTWNG
jgi:RNA polymerase sigma factor (sigma-70 family)